MRIKRDALLWIIIIIPFLKPDCLSGSILSTVWNYMQYFSVVFGLIFIAKKIRSVSCIELSVWCLILMYLMQIVASYMNGLSVYLDVVACIKMFVLLICTAIFAHEGKCKFLVFIYKLFEIIIEINFVTVILFNQRGIVQDSYGEAIYFWSSRNHIIGISIAAIALGAVLVQMKYIKTIRYYVFLIIACLNVFLLKSSTAIIALCIMIFFLAMSLFYKGNKIRTYTRWVVGFGFFLQILVVVFNIQEYFGKWIYLFFGKSTSLTGRTSLWSQAIDFISTEWLWGLGNPATKGMSGWLELGRWNSTTMMTETIQYVAHNQFLEIFLNGGIFCLALFVIFIVLVTKSIMKNNDKKENCILIGAIFCYLVVMITEVVYPYYPVWIFFIVIQQIQNTNIESESNDENNSSYTSI